MREKESNTILYYTVLGYYITIPLGDRQTAICLSIYLLFCQHTTNNLPKIQ